MPKKQPSGEGPKPKRARRASPKRARQPEAPAGVEAEAGRSAPAVEVGFSALAGTRGVEVTGVVNDPTTAGRTLCDRVLDDLLAHGPSVIQGIVDRTGIVGSAVRPCLRGLIVEGKVGEPVGDAYDADRCYRVLVDLDLHGPSTPGDIARRTPIVETVVTTCLDGWVDRGEVEPLGDGLFGRKRP